MAVKKETRSIAYLKAYFHEALHEIQLRLGEVQRKYALPFEVIREYLEVNEPDLVDSLDKLENECDSDLFGKAAAGTASPEECSEWLKAVRDWKHLYIEGINRFENYLILSQVA